MLQRLAGVALQAAVEPLEALSFDSERLAGPSCSWPMAGLALLLQQCFVSLVVGSGCCPTIMLTVCDEHCESPVCESSEQLLPTCRAYVGVC